MPNGANHPVRIRDHGCFLVVVAVLLALVVIALLWLSISHGTLNSPAVWVMIAVAVVVIFLSVRARLRMWPPEAGSVDEFTSWEGMPLSHHVESGAFGDRLMEYASPTLALRLVRDKGQWSVDVSDREGRPDEWYDAALLRNLLEGEGGDVLTFAEQVTVVESRWKEIAGAFGPERRGETHARLAALRKERLQRLVPDLRESQSP